jgi:hypothetical protein
VSARVCAASAAGLRCLCQAPPLVSSDRFQVKATARHSTAFNCPCPDAGVSCLAVVCGCWLVVVWLGSGCWSSARCLGLHSALLCQSLFMCRRFLVDGNLSIHPAQVDISTGGCWGGVCVGCPALFLSSLGMLMACLMLDMTSCHPHVEARLGFWQGVLF